MPSDGLESATSIRVTVVNTLGLHARSAARIAELAQRARSPIWVCKGDDRAEAGDILELLMLQCPQGTGLTLRAEDREDAAVLAAIAQLFAEGFGEQTENE